MDINLLMVILVVVALLLVAIALVVQRWQRSRALRERFGPEYDQMLSQTGDRRQAESELEARQKRVAGFNLRPLSAADSQRFSNAWQAVQTRFVDEPRQAVVDADQLVLEAMQARGYPMGDFEQRAADLSVEHAATLAHYRAARGIAEANAAGRAGTEALRQGMVHYRALFDDLLGGLAESDRKELSR